MDYNVYTQNVGFSFERGQQAEDSRAVIRTPSVERATDLEFAREHVSLSLPTLLPLTERGLSPVSPDSFLAALKEEGGIKDPDTLSKNCRDAVNALKAKHVLDKYILTDEEAAVLCAIPILLDEGFSIRAMIESCRDNEPSKLTRMMLTALRKLQRYRDVVYMQSKSHQQMDRKQGEITRPTLCFAFKDVNSITENDDGTESGAYKEIFRVDEGWGYDMSDFVLFRDAEGHYCTT